jgi:hypothetical protein
MPWVRSTTIALLCALSLSACGPGGNRPPDGSGVYLDSTEIILRESYPVQAALVLRGNLATPCHSLRVVVEPADDQNRILVQLTADADPNQACIQVLDPFEETVELGSFTTGNYSVWVNGEPVGEIDLG